MYAKVRIPPDQTRIPRRTKVERIASCSSLSSVASFILPRMPFFFSSFFFSSMVILCGVNIYRQKRETLRSLSDKLVVTYHHLVVHHPHPY